MTDNKKTFYWAAQFFGWLLYLCVVLVYNLFGDQLTPEALISSGFIIIVGICMTHAYRGLILRFDWLKLPLLHAIPRVLAGGFIVSLICFSLHDLITQLFLPNVESFFSYSSAQILNMVLNWTLLIVFWSIFYFTAHYFFNYRRQEITNLRLEASQNEIELNNLKSQLNPHFMFNALNGIRALVDEDKIKAKEAITQLSILLRASLNTGKQKTIKLQDEVSLVENYLALEKMRFEDRLQIEVNLPQSMKGLDFPPLMLQTVVENAVKHGISKLPNGGVIRILGEETVENYIIAVSNTGTLEQNSVNISQGVGLKNTRRRLKLIYGKEAFLTIDHDGKEVRTEIIIPKK